MKRFAPLSLIAALTIPGAAFGQASDMKGMDMKQGCMDMKDMKGMDMSACKRMTKEKTSDSKVQGTPKKGAVHKTSGVVKALDQANGKVTLAHDQVKTLNWPPMTMSFGVKDKSLLQKLAVGKKVDVEFTQQGSNYIISSVK
ncbi:MULTISPECIES: copper-binding protein [Massilia]|uniref:Copper-binding protein n=2 Tax=Massilia TaxID=149698 RepID=A0A5C7FUH0_9BURK|nr:MULTISPECIES: copper-binding protein [Massilia]TXF98363.1 copper-binding protein [Massilia arenae]